VGLLPAFLAYRKGRNFYDWWVFGAILFPIALVAVILIKPRQVGDAALKPYSKDEPGMSTEG